MSDYVDGSGVDQRVGPPTLRLRALAPGLTVNDVDTSLGFYRDVLGFHVKREWEEDGRVLGAELVAGSVNLMIGQDDWAKGRDRTKGVGFRIYLTTAEDIDELAAQVVARGGVLDHEPQDMPWGARVFSITDPDGFALTISTEADG